MDASRTDAFHFESDSPTDLSLDLDTPSEPMRLEHVHETHPESGQPIGGVSVGEGLSISWHDGPLGRVHPSQEQNGATLEDVAETLISRCEFYQQHPSSVSIGTGLAIQKFKEGLFWLSTREPLNPPEEPS